MLLYAGHKGLLRGLPHIVLTPLLLLLQPPLQASLSCQTPYTSAQALLACSSTQATRGRREACPR